MSSMQNTVEKLKFKGHKPIPPVKEQEDVALVRRPPEIQANDVFDGCVFSGTASGKSADVKVSLIRICFSLILVDCLTLNYWFLHLNRSTIATLWTEESGHCRKVAVNIDIMVISTKLKL